MQLNFGLNIIWSSSEPKKILMIKQTKRGISSNKLDMISNDPNQKRSNRYEYFNSSNWNDICLLLMYEIITLQYVENKYIPIIKCLEKKNSDIMTCANTLYN